MAVLDIRQRTGWLFLAVTVGHILVISAQVNTARGVPMLEEVTFGLFSEVQRAATSLINLVTGGWTEYVALRGVREDNTRLTDEVASLRISLQQERALAEESRSLQRLLDMRSSIPFKTTGASVIAGGASPDFRTITIDKGTGDGLTSDMAVLAPGGVVGRIITPTPRASKVQLLIDRNAAAGAVIERSRAQGVVMGTGTDRFRLEHVSPLADIQVGDHVVTSGIEGIYPKGFLIGQIESLDRQGGEFVDIVVRPAAAFSDLEFVLVVVSPSASEAR
jgi:rod shape-determining protein MreC